METWWRKPRSGVDDAGIEQTEHPTVGPAHEIACDESGWEGANLVAGSSDVIAYASVRLSVEAAAECLCELSGHARQVTRELAQTPAYACSKRERNKIEALFSELKLRVGLRRVRLRRLWNVAEQFYLAATAQNLKRLVKFLAQREALELSTA